MSDAEQLLRLGEAGGTGRGPGRFASFARSFVSPILRPGRRRGPAPAPRQPVFLADIVISSGSELKDRLLEQGLSPAEVMLKYCWPRYAPPQDAGIMFLGKSENLSSQFGRLIAMHHEAPASFPMPVGTVRSTNDEFVGYLLEHVRGETLHALLSVGMVNEARRRLSIVESTIARLHAKSMPHGDINPSNIIAADDGRTLLIDPVANPGSGTALQDELCIAQIKRQIDETPPRPAD